MKKVIITAITAILCISAAIGIRADAIYKKDDGESIASVISMNGYQKMPCLLAKQIDNDNDLYMKFMCGTDEKSIYVVSTVNEKIGYYVVENGNYIREYNDRIDGVYISSEDPTDKITDELFEKMENNETILTYIWLHDIEIEKSSEKNADRTAEEVRDQVINQRVYAENLYTKYNGNFVSEYIPELAEKITTYNAEEREESPKCYICSYAPMCIAKITPDKVLELAKCNIVEEIGYLAPLEHSDELSIATQAIQGTYSRDTNDCRGDGAIIGILESGGIPNLSYSQLSGADITVRSGDTGTSNHATEVATIIAGQTLGLAPDCEVYAAKLSNFFADVEWLISEGVYAINCSFKLNNDQGLYNIYSKWVDHVDMNHDVLVVKSSGNSGYVSTPGMAYNAITVGAFDDNNSVTYTDDTMASFSGYTEASGYAEKPDIIAPGYNITFPGLETNSGTSFSAPMVTGVVAQIIDAKPALAD